MNHAEVSYKHKAQHSSHTLAVRKAIFEKRLALRNSCFSMIIVSLLSVSLSQKQEQTTNACGPSNLGFLSVLIPNGPFPLSLNLFEEACKTHDLCYSLNQLEASQARCDQDFRESMLSTCASTYIEDNFTKGYCDALAGFYYSLVDGYGETSVALDLANYDLSEADKTIANFATLELNQATIVPSFSGDDLRLCVDFTNTSSINTHFKLFLYAAEDRSSGELPQDDFLLAWFPLFEEDSVFLRAKETQTLCLGTDGFIGIARNAAQLKGAYKLELWVDSARSDIGFKLADSLEGRAPSNEPIVFTQN
jgi:hypothetical protein